LAETGDAPKIILIQASVTGPKICKSGPGSYSITYTVNFDN